MRNMRAEGKRKIPESLGNSVCGVWPYVVALVCDAALHTVLFILYKPDFYGFARLTLSFIFFVYPFHYVADILWSLRPSVRDILGGKLRINRKHYMNTVRREVEKSALLNVTISVPVYTEDNAVIFRTLRESLAAARRYREYSGRMANVLVSEDGLAPLLRGSCEKDRLDAIVEALDSAPLSLSPRECKAAERVRFYREHGIGFVARPASDRAGLFKKSSNLNYTLRMGGAAAEGASIESLIGDHGAFAGGYAEGDITTHEIILLLDKDSGVKERVIEAIVPEFAADEKLAYVQCATNAANLYENYFTYATGHQINTLFHNTWPCRALQGFFVPLVGHNAFLRKSILEKSGLWAENRVSEDFDKALYLYRMGYHGKYAQLRGLEFTEYASRTFTEETGKQHRYAYGLFEMMFDGTLVIGQTRGCDILHMVLYFFSVLNQVMLLPTVLAECYFGNIHLLWAGFLFCNICFIFLPFIRGLVMRRRLPKEQSENLLSTAMVAVSFVGHSCSMLSGACRYLFNKIKPNRAPFPSTNVDEMEYRFRDGMRLLAEFARKNKWYLLIALLCLDRGMFMITRKGIEPITVVIYSYILFSVILTPPLLTPHLFAPFRPRMAPAHTTTGNTIAKKELTMNEKHREYAATQWNADLRILSPRVVQSAQGPDEGTVQSDIDSFLSSYGETLRETLPAEHMPTALATDYVFESCIRKDPEGKKEIYLLRRRSDEVPALLRITKDYPEEDALEEAKLLGALDHPCIPKVYASFEQAGKAYVVREYIEGRPLYDIVKSTGCLSAEDIFRVMLKLTDILLYLHSRVPPVIHRDIKPQNIIVGKDGGIHLIDFGIARLHKRERTQDTAVVLTLDYASPEQYGFEQTTPLSDIYSLGVVMLFLATQRTTRSGLESQIVNNRLRNLIERCIAFNPESRFQSVQELRGAILRDTTHKSSRQRRAFALAALPIVAVVLLSACFYGAGIHLGKTQGSATGYQRGYDVGYTDGYESVPIFKTLEAGEPSRDGNLPGNMAIPSGAFAAQGDGVVFYIAQGDIYRMHPSGADVELLVRDGGARALSYRNGWLYYSTGREIRQTNIYTLQSDVLCEDVSGELFVVDDSYLVKEDDALSLLNLTSREMAPLGALPSCEYLNIDGDGMVFIHASDEDLYRSNLDGTGLTRLANGVCTSVCAFDGSLYASVYDGEHGSLRRLDSVTGEGTTLAQINAVEVNATGKGIYYIDAFDRTINVCALDGRIRLNISGNRAADYNIAGDWIFYHNEEADGRLWCVRLDGTNDHPVQTEGGDS